MCSHVSTCTGKLPRAAIDCFFFYRPRMLCFLTPRVFCRGWLLETLYDFYPKALLVVSQHLWLFTSCYKFSLLARARC